MNIFKFLNLLFIILGVTGSIYTLYSIFIRNIKKEMHKIEDDIIFRLKNANH